MLKGYIKLIVIYSLGGKKIMLLLEIFLKLDPQLVKKIVLILKADLCKMWYKDVFLEK